MAADTGPAREHPVAEEKSSLTVHSITTNGRRIKYEATAGTLPLRDEHGQLTARMFYVAYVVSQSPGSPARPVTFFFNGGPGSSSIWLHMGAFGPMRVPIAPPGVAMSPPYRLIPNDQTLLDRTDMVFVDAVGTGFSRSLDTANNKLYWGNDEDAASFVQAITQYLELADRWNAPKFLFGESFGTMRAAIVADRLHGKGVNLDGIIMLSSILNFGHFASGLDQYAIDLLPSFAATAWYHDKIPHGPQGLVGLVQEARDYARGEYAVALAKGFLLPDGERDRVAARLSELTGLTADFLKRSNLRVGIGEFRRELLRGRRISVGATDTRFTEAEANGVGEKATFDAAEDAIAPAYISAFNTYLTSELHYRSELDYIANDDAHIMAEWDWTHRPPNAEKQTSMANVIPDLAAALQRNPALKVLSLNGYFDLMTPFFGTEFDLAKLPLSSTSQDRIQYRYYESGHMVYVSEPALRALRTDIAHFYDEVLEPRRIN